MVPQGAQGLRMLSGSCRVTRLIVGALARRNLLLLAGQELQACRVLHARSRMLLQTEAGIWSGAAHCIKLSMPASKWPSSPGLRAERCDLVSFLLMQARQGCV